VKTNYDIVILGAGESAVGTAMLASKVGLSAFVSDNRKIADKYRVELDKLGVVYEEEGHSLDLIYSAPVIVKSPGIPDSVKMIVDAKDKGIQVISEMEFAYPYIKGTTVGVTGSNGKTTTTLMINHMLEKAGLKSVACGNVGKSLARVVAENQYTHFVIELSSFQLDGIEKFRTDIAVLTNITPDHLDRYEYKMQNYVNSKFRIAMNQTESDVFIYNADDRVVMGELQTKQIKAKQIPFSMEHAVEKGAYIQNEQIITNINNKQTKMSIHELAQQGKHNAYNSMASGIAGRVLEIRKEVIRESLSDFQNVEHRLEHVANIHGIEWVNDSKATNVNSTWFALESMQKPTIWIAGGVDKGNDYDFLKGLVKQKVVGMVCLGEDNTKLHAAFDDVVENVWDAKSADEAVGLAYRLAKKGYAVLLSPACASFDLFENYEERGLQFKRAVRSL